MKKKELPSNMPQKLNPDGTSSFRIADRIFSVVKRHSGKKTKTSLVEKSELIIKYKKNKKRQVSAIPKKTMFAVINRSRVNFWVNIFLPIILFILSLTLNFIYTRTASP